MMKKNLITIVILAICSFSLMACSDDNQDTETAETESDTTKDDTNQETDSNEGKINVPEDLVIDAEADPIEIKDQMGLEIGETGYAGKPFEEGVLAITLNGVENTQS